MTESNAFKVAQQIVRCANSPDLGDLRAETIRYVAVGALDPYSDIPIDSQAASLIAQLVDVATYLGIALAEVIDAAREYAQ